MSAAASTIAALLRRRRDDIVARWAGAERVRRPDLASLDTEDLIDSLPVLLEELAEHLADHNEDARFDGDILETAAVHGAQRVRVRVPLKYLLEEYAILRRILTGLIDEERLAVGRDELEQLHAALDAAVRRSATTYVAVADAARDRLIGIVGHDLRNPLNAILIGAEALRLRVPPGGPEARIVTRVARSSESALRMIRDLLDYSQVASHHGAIPINATPTDLAAVVAQVIDETRQAFPQRAILYDAPEGAIEGAIEGVWDSDRLAQVATNLIRNALQYSSAASPVSVRVFALDDERACFEVHNEGEPIAPALLPRLFDAFQQGDGGSGRGEGNVGLGLYIAHEVVRGHRGQIDVDSRAGAGTTFRVTLPRRADAPGPTLMPGAGLSDP